MKYEETKIQIAASDAHMAACEDMLKDYDGPRITALDLGAHVGTRSLWLATDGGFDKVWAVECSVENFKLLRRNISNNGLRDRIIPVLAAVDIDTHSCRIQYAGVNRGQCSIAYRPKNYNYYMVTTPLETLVDSTGDMIDFVKCDVEGTEYSLFADIEKLNCLSDVQAMFIETHAPNSDFFDPDWLAALGYDPQDPNQKLYDNVRQLGFKIDITPIGQIMAQKSIKG